MNKYFKKILFTAFIFSLIFLEFKTLLYRENVACDYITIFPEEDEEDEEDIFFSRRGSLYSLGIYSKVDNKKVDNSQPGINGVGCSITEKSSVIKFSPGVDAPHTYLMIFVNQIGDVDLDVELYEIEGDEEILLIKETVRIFEPMGFSPESLLHKGWNEILLPYPALNSKKKYKYVIKTLKSSGKNTVIATDNDGKIAFKQCYADYPENISLEITKKCEKKQFPINNKLLTNMSLRFFSSGECKLRYGPLYAWDIYKDAFNGDSWSYPGYKYETYSLIQRLFICYQTKGEERDGIVFKISCPYPITKGTINGLFSNFSDRKKLTAKILVSPDGRDENYKEIASGTCRDNLQYLVKGNLDMFYGKELYVKYTLSRKNSYMGFNAIWMDFNCDASALNLSRNFVNIESIKVISQKNNSKFYLKLAYLGYKNIFKKLLLNVFKSSRKIFSSFKAFAIWLIFWLLLYFFIPRYSSFEIKFVYTIILIYLIAGVIINLPIIAT